MSEERRYHKHDRCGPRFRATRRAQKSVIKRKLAEGSSLDEAIESVPDAWRDMDISEEELFFKEAAFGVVERNVRLGR